MENLDSSQKSYPAKVLLFGEYTVLHGSQSLAVPFFEKSACWTLEKSVDPRLLQFTNWLQQQTVLAERINLELLLKEITDGWQVKSTVPEGYGLGSSGLVCAAIMDRFGIDFEHDSLEQQKKFFSFMESYYHGSSSGFDPLISFNRCACLVQGEQLTSITLRSDPGAGRFFLLDSGSTRSTAQAVAYYQTQTCSKDFLKVAEKVWMPAIEVCIQCLIHGGDRGKLQVACCVISQFQWEHMQDYIAQSIRPIWLHGLLSGDYFLKLSGAGMGGMYLGWAADPDKIPSEAMLM